MTDAGKRVFCGGWLAASAGRVRSVASLGCALAVLLAARPALAQRELKDIPPPDPEIERQTFQLPEGFEVNLYASDPQIAKPIQMSFDPRGRLWIASSQTYPHIRPGERHDDRILIVEDRDGDGTAETTSVFADGLLIPTGLEPGDGGVYVANSTELLHLRDTDGDGKADESRVVLSGFGTEDTHHLLHTLRWGPDGRLYMNQSIYIHSHIETPYGVRRLNGGGIWQFRPETYRLEVFARGWVNAWGHHFDDFGQSFVTDGAGGEGINYVVPGAAYPAAVGVPRILHGLNPGSPKYCGLEVVGGRHLPDDWQGNLITNDFRGNRVCRFALKDDGAGFAAQQLPDLIKSSHVAFRPVDVKMGPDGAIYIADWYNPIIQHGEVDFRDPRRDHTHGRIWRVTVRGRPLVQRPDLAGASDDELLEQLKSSEAWTRQQAKRVLKERGGDDLPARTAAWAGRLDPDDPLHERHQLEALWVLQALRAPHPELLGKLMQARDPRVRAAAARVLQEWHDRVPHAAELLARQVADEHPRVRLEAVRVLAQMREPRSVEMALRALDRTVDAWLDYALWLTARDLQSAWFDAFQAGRLTFDGHSERATFALKAIGSPAVVPTLLARLRAESVSNREAAELLQLVAALSGPNELRQVFDAALADTLPADRRVLYLQALAQAAEQRKVKPAGELAEIGRLLDDHDVSVQTEAARCVGLWKLEALETRLARLAAAHLQAGTLREAHLLALAALGGAESRSVLELVAASEQSPAYRALGVTGLVELDAGRAVPAAVKFLEELAADGDPSVVLGAFLRYRPGPKLLAAGLAGRRIPADVAKLALRAVSAAGRSEPELEAALAAAGGISAGPMKLSADELQDILAAVSGQGDPRVGEAIFRRSELGCLKCHAVGGAGGRVGPDLLSLGTSAQVDYLVESLVDPNAKVKENYHTVVAVTTDGRIHTGVKVRQTDTHLILRDVEDREVGIPLELIDEQAPGSSIMPAGLTEKLTRAELVHLVRFLSELGRDGPYRVGTERVVRRWQVLLPTPEALFRLRRTSYETAAGDDPAYTWGPAYSTVAGVLPLRDLPVLRVPNRGEAGVALARCELEVTTPGPCRLRFNSVDGLQLWVNQTPAELAEETTVSLERGVHRLTLAIELSARTEDLRVELVDAAGSSARAQVVGGK